MKSVAALSLVSIIAFATLRSGAQGTLYISTLNLVSAGSQSIANDAWLAQSFFTGGFPSGYVLDSVQLRMNTPSGTPTGFGVSIYAATGGFPGSLVGSLIGPSPLASGDFSYAASGIPLLPSTSYFVVANSASPASSGAFSWSLVGSGFADITGGWGYAPYQSSESSDGLEWARTGLNFHMAVYATLVPEPSSLVMAGLGGLVLAAARARMGAKR
jgi:hypothetical protein